MDSDASLKKSLDTPLFFRENCLLQFSLGEQYPDSFKWCVITKIAPDNITVDLSTLDYQAYNHDDEKIDSLDESEVEIKKLQPVIQRLKSVPVDELKSSEYNILHHLIPKKEDDVEDSLYYAHELDSSSLLKKLKEQPSQVKEENNDEGGGIVSAVIKIVSGIVSLVVAAIMIACSIVAAAIGLILSGLEPYKVG